MDDVRREELKRLSAQLVAQFPAAEEDQRYLLRLIRQWVEDFPRRHSGNGDRR